MNIFVGEVEKRIIVFLNSRFFLIICASRLCFRDVPLSMKEINISYKCTQYGHSE